MSGLWNIYSTWVYKHTLAIRNTVVYYALNYCNIQTGLFISIKYLYIRIIIEIILMINKFMYYTSCFVKSIAALDIGKMIELL